MNNSFSKALLQKNSLLDVNLPTSRQYILIIASSARMLVQASARVGLRPLVIDLFADLDTQRYAEAFIRVPALSPGYLAQAMDFFIERYTVIHAIYGSGLENYPESLHYLNDRLILLGNTPDAFTRLQDKADFFSVLAELGIPFPDISFNAPQSAYNWLIKPMRGQGGQGIKYYRHELSEPSVYWQRYCSGIPQSVLFLADGQTAQVIGFNTQWTIKTAESKPFIFSGIINDSCLPNRHKAIISGWLAEFVPVFGLKGLNTLDFIQDGDDTYVLEINPRLSASVQLYDIEILSQHINASQGVMPSHRSIQNGYTGYQVIYAEQDGIMIPKAFQWPEYCLDLPSDDVCYRKGEPICSIIARHKTARHVLEQLRIKQQNILNQLHRRTLWNTPQA